MSINRLNGLTLTGLVFPYYQSLPGQLLGKQGLVTAVELSDQHVMGVFSLIS